MTTAGMVGSEQKRVSVPLQYELENPTLQASHSIAHPEQQACDQCEQELETHIALSALLIFSS